MFIITDFLSKNDCIKICYLLLCALEKQESDEEEDDFRFGAQKLGELKKLRESGASDEGGSYGCC